MSERPIGPEDGRDQAAGFLAGGHVPPKRVGDYVLEAPLGRGGMAQVFLAKDPAGRRVAVKVMEPGKSQARFQREGELVARLDHPNVLKVYGAGVDGEHAYLVCELVEEAQTLEEAMQGVGLREAVMILRAAVRGLAYAHANGIVHRDVKPENILIDRQGGVRIADFGLGLAADVAPLTRTGALLGTPFFMAPEQFEGRRDHVGPWTDVWALGVILFRIATGELPFEGPSLPALAAQVGAGTPAAGGAPRALRRICARALAREPADRYPDAGAFGADLDLYLQGETPGLTLGARGRLALGIGLGALLGVGALGLAWSVSDRLAPAAPVKPATLPEPPTLHRPSKPAPPRPPSPRLKRSAALAAGFLEAGELVDAEREFRYVLEQVPAGTELHQQALSGLCRTLGQRLERGILDQATFDLDLAERFSALAEGLAPSARSEHADLLVRCAKLADVGSKLDEAVALLSCARKIASETDWLDHYVARVHLERAEAQKAKATLRRASRERAETHALLAEVALAEGDLAAAKASLDEASVLESDPIAVLRARALLAERERRYAEGLPLAEKALRDRPGDAVLLALACRLRLETGDARGALRLVKELDELRRSDACWRLRYRASYALKDYPDAEWSLQHITDANPADVDTILLAAESALHKYLGGWHTLEYCQYLVLAELTPKQRARRAYLLDKTYGKMESELSEVGKGLVRVEQGRWAEALAVLEAAETNAPWHRFLGLGRCMAALGRLDDAEAEFAKSIEAAPEHVRWRVLVRQALLAQARGETARAKALQEQAKEDAKVQREVRPRHLRFVERLLD